MSDRLLVLGGEGLVGHQVVRAAAAAGVPTWWTARGAGTAGAAALGADGLIAHTDLTDPDRVRAAIDAARPTAVVNCAGIVKQRTGLVADSVVVAVNAWLPHLLAEISQERDIRLVHLSTDCVFASPPRHPEGHRVGDPADATDLYGRSKLLGEVDGPGTCTVRTSVVGPELTSSSGLLAWLLGAEGAVEGWTHARFSGLASPELARRLLALALDHPGIEGLWHLAGPSIAKHDLLVEIVDAFGLDLAVVPHDGVAIDRSLDGRPLAEAMGWVPPTWPEMVAELASLHHDPSHRSPS